MDGFEKTVNNGLNKVTDDNLVDIKPIDENFEIVDDKLGNVGLVELEGYNDAVDGHKDVSNLIKYAFKKAKAGVDGLKDTAINVTTWGNQTLDKVLQALKDRQADTIKPNLAISTTSEWATYTVTTSKGQLQDTGSKLVTSDLKVNDKITISIDVKFSTRTLDSAVTPALIMRLFATNSDTYLTFDTVNPVTVADNTIIRATKTIDVTSVMLAQQYLSIFLRVDGLSAVTVSYRSITINRGVTESSYIQSEIDIAQARKDIATKAGTAVATTSTNGLMSSSDKAKLDNITIANYYNKNDMDSKLATKADTAVATNNSNGLMASTDKVKLDNLYDAELLDRQDIVKLNDVITGEDALIDANNIKFAQLLGVDIETIKGQVI